MAKFKKNKEVAIKLKKITTESNVWMNFEAWKFEKKWKDLQMNGGTKTVNVK